MTICFNNDFERCKFFARCLYKSNGHRDTYSSIFDSVNCLFGCGYQVEVKSDVLSVSDVENILKENKVKYNWVNQY